MSRFYSRNELKKSFFCMKSDLFFCFLQRKTRLWGNYEKPETGYVSSFYAIT